MKSSSAFITLSSFIIVLLIVFGILNKCVHGAPAWIPSNITFERLNETHIQIKYKDKVIEILDVKQYDQSDKIFDAEKSTVSFKKLNQIQTRNNDNDNFQRIQKDYDHQNWIKINLCYFNPVTCFIGNKE